MAENPKQHNHGLKWRARKDGRIPIWMAPEKDIRAGYPVKYVQLPREWTQEQIEDRCRKLWNDLADWRKGQNQKPTRHTIRWLIDRYQTDEFSPYRNLKPETQKGYAEFSRIINHEIGSRLIGFQQDRTPLISGEHVLGWYAAWSRNGKNVSRAKHLIAHVRLLLSYAALLGVPGATETRAMLSAMRFPSPPPRDVAPTRAQVMAIVEKAQTKECGEWFSIAATTLAQYELMERRIHIWDWQWEQITPDWRIVYFQNKKGQVRREFNLTTVQPLLALLQKMKPNKEDRAGHVILCETTDQPWTKRYYDTVFRQIARAAGVPDTVWSMDMRAGGITEADGIAAIPPKWIQHGAGHAIPSTTERYRREKQRNAQNVVELRQKASKE